MTPDPWQADLMTARPDRALLLCSRQAGKSMTVAAIGLEQALTNPVQRRCWLAPPNVRAPSCSQSRGLAMAQQAQIGLERCLFSPCDCTTAAASCGSPVRRNSSEATRPTCSIVDETAWIPDSLYQSVRPMLAVSHGRLIALSTPYGQRGWFFSAWVGSEPWLRVKVTAYEVPRITNEFLDEERRSLPASVFAAEYLCEFSDTLANVFSTDDVLDALTADVLPLFGPKAMKRTLTQSFFPYSVGELLREASLFAGCRYRPVSRLHSSIVIERVGEELHRAPHPTLAFGDQLPGTGEAHYGPR